MGRQLDDFEVLERLGEDATGELYLACQVSLDRPVVLKVLPEGLLDDAGVVARFRTEATVAGTIEHPGVVRVLKWGCTDLRHFIALEHIEGESLAAALAREGPLPVERVIPLIKDVADALVTVHASGVLHCGIQPAGIVVGADGRARLTGFALARRLGESTGFWRPAPPLYYPPEAVLPRPLDERADLFLLGATLYHALTGSPPFDGPTPEDRAMAYLRAEAPPLGQAVPTAPMALCLLVQRVLRRDPEARYQSAVELLEGLERIEALVRRSQAPPERERPAPAKPSRPERRAARPKRSEVRRTPERRASGRAAPAVELTPAQLKERKRRILIAATAVAIVLLTVLVGALLPWAMRDRTVAVARPQPRNLYEPSTPLPPVPKPAKRTTGPPQGTPAYAPPARTPEPVVLKAADARVEGDAKYETEPDKDCIGFWSDPSASVWWEFRVTAPGTCSVEVDFAAEGAAVDNEYVVAVGGQELKGIVSNTGKWTTFKAVTIGRIVFEKAGLHRLSVRPGRKKSAQAPLMNLRAVRIRPVR